MDTKAIRDLLTVLAITGVLVWLDYKVQQRKDYNRMHRDIDRYLHVPFRD